MAVTPVKPPPEQLERMQRLAAWHHEWVQRKLADAPFDSSGRKPGSDYNQHYVDLESDDDEFHARAREIMGIGAPELSKAAHAAALKVDEGAAGDFRARHLIRWYNHGADGKIPWGSPGDFDACVAVATEHAGDQMSPSEIKGFCANRHHDALGIWPATHAARERGKHDA